MSRVLDAHLLPIHCPKCNATIHKTVAWLRENNELACPCGTAMYLGTDEVLLAVEALEEALARIVRPAPDAA